MKAAFMMRRAEMLFVVALVFAASAFLASSSAAARYVPALSTAPPLVRVDSLTRAPCHQYCGVNAFAGSVPVSPTRPIVRTQIVRVPGRGFRWLDAAVGFGVASGAALIAFGVFRTTRRERVPGPRTAF